MLEAVVAVVTLHQRFDFHLSAEHHPDGTIAVNMPGLTRPAHGIWMSAVPRIPQPQSPAVPCTPTPQPHPPAASSAYTQTATQHTQHADHAPRAAAVLRKVCGSVTADVATGG